MLERKLYLFILSGLLAASLITTASAEKENRLYFTEQLGYSSVASGAVSPYQFHNRHTFGFRISGGYLYSISNWLNVGPEVGYGYYGKVSYQNTTGYVSNYKLTGWDILANFKYKLSDLFNLYFKLGLGQFSQQLVINGPNATPGGFYQQKIAPVAAVAASYNATKATELSLGYTHIFANRAPLTSNQNFTFTNVNQVASANAVMLGVTFYL